MITDFHGEHWIFSNFSPCVVMLDEELYPTVENAFQAAKTLDPKTRVIFSSVSAANAKKLGREIKLRPDWEKVKIEIMKGLLEQKFTPSGFPREHLLKTGDEELIEGNTWGDKFWGKVLGNGKWIGENHLGKLLMEIREKLQKEEDELDEILDNLDKEEV